MMDALPSNIGGSSDDEQGDSHPISPNDKTLDTQFRPWSDLPLEILEQFSDHLTFDDLVQFGAVCRAWRSATIRRRHRLALRFPWMLHTSESSSEPIIFDLFSPIENKIHHHKFPLQGSGTWCLGSSAGWMVIEDRSRGYHLLNPLSGQQIQLPNRLRSPDSQAISQLTRRYFSRAILSSPPTSDNLFLGSCLIVALHSRSLAFCRPADEAWSVISSIEQRSRVIDFIFHEGVLYTLTTGGSNQLKVTIFKFDPDLRVERFYNTMTPTITWACDTKPPTTPWNEGDTYLLAYAGKLLVVIIVSFYDRMSQWFRVFEFDPNRNKWVRLTSLGNRTVFLDAKHSNSTMVEDCPAYRRNCIYYTVNSRSSCRCSVFLLEDRSNRPLLPWQATSTFLPFWFMLHA